MNETVSIPRNGIIEIAASVRDIGATLTMSEAMDGPITFPKSKDVKKIAFPVTLA